MLKEGKAAGVDKFLIHSVATKPEQVKSINDFIYGEMQTHDEFIGFMALHPDMDSQDIENEVNRCLALGFKGVKLHPDCQKFFIDEDRAKALMQIYREMEQTVIEHCKEKGIRFSSDYHQYGCGIPIIDNKYMFFLTLREWGRIMSDCDDDYSDKGYLKYYLHGNEHPTKYPNEVGEICIE